GKAFGVQQGTPGFDQIPITLEAHLGAIGQRGPTGTSDPS
ncbi:MAG: hypothetical protein ACI82F_003508, partial [Planctomycetota bacterium]